MGAPGMTYFCENGHIVLDLPHDSYWYVNEDEMLCPFCKSSNIKAIIEWRDENYTNGGDKIVSHTPIGRDEHPHSCPQCGGTTLYPYIFDVRDLFSS